VTFREDESQIYAEDGARNMALFRRALLNLIKAHPLKDSVAGKMMRAGWDSKLEREYCLVKNQPKYNPALRCVYTLVIINDGILLLKYIFMWLFTVLS
jgi:predicted nucleic acid-binding Zn ribbon protein